MADIYLWLTGHLGLQGSIYVNLVLLAVNISLLASNFRRAAHLEFDSLYCAALALYALSAFVHPYCYSFASFDCISQASLACLAAAIRLRLSDRPLTGSGRSGAFFALALLGFLTKETYALAALFVVFLLDLKHRRRFAVSEFRATLLLIAALLFALTWGMLAGSEFLGRGAGIDDPYHVVFLPASVATELGRYLAAAMLPWFAWIVPPIFAAILLSRGANRPIRASALACLGAAVLSCVPNALLPNHFSAGYAWGAMPILLLPILALPTLLAGARGKLLAAGGLLAICAVANARSDFVLNAWNLDQESRQKHLVEGVRFALHDLPAVPGSQRILVSGLAFPYSPFDHPSALRAWEPPGIGISYEKVNYSPVDNRPMTTPDFAARAHPLRTSNPGEFELSQFDRLFLFGLDGTLILGADPGAIRRWSTERCPELSAVEAVAYPAACADTPSGITDASAAGYQWLRVGTDFLQYRAWPLAESALSKSIPRLSGNPYPSYYLGTALLQQGRYVEAATAFQAAVAMAGAAGITNPAFEAAQRSVPRSAAPGAVQK